MGFSRHKVNCAKILVLLGVPLLSVIGAVPSIAQTAGQGVDQSSSEAAGSTPAQASPETSSTNRDVDFDAWRKVCVHSPAQNRDVCGLAYAGLPESPDTQITKSSPLIAVTVQSVGSGDTSRKILVIRTRLGLLLPGGLELRIDNRSPVKAAFRSCHAGRAETGCLVPIRLDGTFERNLKRGITLTVTAKTLRGGSMSQQISLLGITDALNALPPG